MNNLRSFIIHRTINSHPFYWNAENKEWVSSRQNAKIYKRQAVAKWVAENVGGEAIEITPPAKTPTREQVIAALSILQSLINTWNDSAEDGDRGRANDMLVLTIWDDGSGRIGRATGYTEDMGTSCDLYMDIHDGFNELEGLADILLA